MTEMEKTTMQLLFPDASLRSPTAVPGKSDIRDENIYSAAVVTNGATGNTTVFTVPRGQTIPKLGATAAATHQATYSEITTNISQAGQLGSAIGEASLRAIGCTIESQYPGAAYGAGLQEVSEILAKCFFQIRIGGKLQIQGPVQFFPAASGIVGNSVVNASSVVGNGAVGSMRRLKVPILVARTDTVEGTIGVAGGASLSFADGYPTLLWFNVHALTKGDAR